MLDQWGDVISCWNHNGRKSDTVTIQVPKRHILAEIALTDSGVLGRPEHHLSSVYITQIISDRGVENFDFCAMKKVISRTNVTSITFRIEVYNSGTAARWMINFWS